MIIDVRVFLVVDQKISELLVDDVDIQASNKVDVCRF
jgi:hypothetical protein